MSGVRKRSKVACVRCSSRKVRCSGDRPACRACIISNNALSCSYPVKAKKISVLDTELRQLKQRVEELETECCRLEKLSTGSKVDSKSGTKTYQDPLALKEPEIGPKIPGNSSCLMFVCALKRHLNRTSIDNEGEKIANEDHYYQRKRIACKRIYLDDEELELNTASPKLPEKEFAIKLARKVHDFLGNEFGLFDMKKLEEKINQTYENSGALDTSWFACLFSIFAVGEQFMGNDPATSLVPGKRFFLTALRYLNKPVEEPTLNTLRALLLVAIYSKGLNRIYSVFTYMGNAVSTAIILGMHRDVCNLGLPKQLQDERKKLWWLTYFLDVIWSSRIGLPPHLNSDYIDIGFPDATLATEGFSPVYLIANTKMAVCIAAVMKEVYVTSGKDNFMLNIIRSLKQLESFFDALDPEIKDLSSSSPKFNRSKALIHLRYNQVIIVTSRPLYLSLLRTREKCNGDIGYAKQKCVQAAVDNVNILNQLWENGCFCKSGFLEAQCCFSSLLMLVMETLDGNSFPQLATALSLNAIMCENNNITAVDNHSRLKELDCFLFKAERSTSEPGESENPNTAVLGHNKEMSDIDLPFLVELESSGAAFHNFSPDTFHNLSVNFERWDSFLEFPFDNLC